LKYFPMLKVLTVFFWLLSCYRKEIRECNVIYCHTLWSDGVAGFLLARIFNKKLVVTVRSADLSIFLPKLFYYRWLLKMVVDFSDKVIFISPSYRNKVISKYSKIFQLSKCEVVSNGIDSFWFQQHFKKEPSKTVLFVGRFCFNKQINKLYETIVNLKKHEHELKFIALGGSVEKFKDICGVNSIPDWVEVIEYSDSKLQLAKLYSQSAVMALPSINETFGLVYLEALSQGCPVIHLKGEAIDGLFDDHKSITSVEHSDEVALSKAILGFVLKNEDLSYKVPAEVQSKIKIDFSWVFLAKKLVKLIRE
ncbi:glycosyltransferase family 4 protein, partial [Pseudoalteromonas sp. Isolate3]|uniref:glycosyltransferase family 4 protein n=1 Tax=Pseudoalteromonas sp. Isolate3 TaxID=2908526 RepID=UPI001EFEDCBA